MPVEPLDPSRPAAAGALPDGYLVRPAVAADVARLTAIELAAGALFRDVGMDDIAADEGQDPATLEAAAIDGRLWVAEADGEPVGYALVVDLDGEHHLEQLSVDPAHGRRGLGAALVAAADRWAAGLGGRSLTLCTFSDVPWNRPYYERLGFVVVDEAALSPALLAVRAHEAADGLDPATRVVMRRPVGAG
ncbi:MAG TPA: GNAT family N-acetyltransferase [Aquihabitans sp.]|nr:GNAT family N-acetyltransferase [Aquihabitans sp.]